MLKHFQRNCELEKKIGWVLDETGHLNGQGRLPVGIMSFGNSTAGFSACEVIAVYNVLNDLGIHRRLSDLIYDAEKLGFLFARGFFGTKINKIPKLLEYYGVRCEKVKARDFIEKARNNDYEDGQMFIITIRNRCDVPVCAIHTFEAVYYEGKWEVFNRFNKDKKSRKCGNIADILRNGEIIGAFYSIFRILV